MNEAKTILIVDDSADDALLLKLVLKQAGVLNPVVVLGDGDEALAYLEGDGAFADREKHPLPSIMFVDLKMPRFNGFQVLEWLRDQSQLHSILVIVLTGDWEMRGVNRAYRLRAHSFLVKPCNAPDIINLANAFPGYWITSPPADAE